MMDAHYLAHLNGTTTLTKPTPVFDRAGVTLYANSCGEVLPFIKADGLLSDPPWHLNGYPERVRKLGTVHLEEELDWLSKLWLWYASWMTLVQATEIKWAWVFMGYDHAPMFLRMAHLLGFTHQHAWVYPGHEWLLYLNDTPLPDREILFVHSAIRQHGHPTVKPVELMQALLVASGTVEQTILDPFAGDGSSLLAAASMGNRAVGVEVDPARVETMLSRLVEAL